nr:ATP synthase F0 subunit 8 [Megymenum brevicorne]
MPQMSPLWWETLYMYFTFMFMMTLIYIYHMNLKTNINKINFIINKNQMNWKW